MRDRPWGSVQAPGWPATAAVYVADKAPVPLPGDSAAQGQACRPPALSEAGAALERGIAAAAEAVAGAAEELDDWDSRVGDGDCGATLKRAVLAIQEVTR